MHFIYPRIVSIVSATMLLTSVMGFHSSRHLLRRSKPIGVSVKDVLLNPKWPVKWPFTPQDFARQDESTDNNFYNQPRFVYHIDDAAIASLTKYYSEVLKPGASVLDICSSWVSHYPTQLKLGRTAGLGMNELELSKNPQLSEYAVQDLNKNPKFPYEDNSFDYVTCVVSVDCK